MPLYEYECKKCGKVSEIIQKFSDAPLEKCDICCGKLHKLISSNAFHLKGNGWYVSDYGKSSSKKRTLENTSNNKQKKTKADSEKHN